MNTVEVMARFLLTALFLVSLIALVVGGVLDMTRRP